MQVVLYTVSEAVVIIITRKPPVQMGIKRIPVTTPSQPPCAGRSAPGIPAEGLW